MVEFDVRAWEGELVLAHTVLHARRGGNVRLQDALAHLAGRRFTDVELNVDVKHVGCERRCSITCASGAARADTDLLAGAGRGRRGPCARAAGSCRYLGRRADRAAEPRWRDWRAVALAGIHTGRWDALMAQHKLVDGGLWTTSTTGAAGCTPGP